MQLTPEEHELLPRRFAEELKFGKDYHKAHQNYEKTKIDAGADLDDPHFYDAFQTEHGPIASSVGKSNFLLVTKASPLGNWPVGLAMGGVGGFLAALLRRPAKSGTAI